MGIKKIFIYIVTGIILSGCAQSTAMLAPAISFASSGNISQAGLTYITNKTVEKKTGMNTLQYVADKTIDAETRECEINHSAEINQIFFETLDELDCKISK
tara:strand:+ start:139 stop:441 length:303 start_codon:yes stop_codon:yes gene_type:complete